MCEPSEIKEKEFDISGTMERILQFTIHIYNVHGIRPLRVSLMRSSGFAEPRYLVRRKDGRTLKVSISV